MQLKENIFQKIRAGSIVAGQDCSTCGLFKWFQGKKHHNVECATFLEMQKNVEL